MSIARTETATSPKNSSKLSENCEPSALILFNPARRAKNNLIYITIHTIIVNDIKTCVTRFTSFWILIATKRNKCKPASSFIPTPVQTSNNRQYILVHYPSTSAILHLSSLCNTTQHREQTKQCR